MVHWGKTLDHKNIKRKNILLDQEMMMVDTHTHRLAEEKRRYRRPHRETGGPKRDPLLMDSLAESQSIHLFSGRARFQPRGSAGGARCVHNPFKRYRRPLSSMRKENIKLLSSLFLAQCARKSVYLFTDNQATTDTANH